MWLKNNPFVFRAGATLILSHAGFAKTLPPYCVLNKPCTVLLITIEQGKHITTYTGSAEMPKYNKRMFEDKQTTRVEYGHVWRL